MQAPERYGAKDTRNGFDVLREALQGADRVVVETKNAIGEMDAHYLHAPTILEGLAQAVQDAREAALREAAEETRTWQAFTRYAKERISDEMADAILALIQSAPKEEE